MTDTEINAAIAEACGWRVLYNCTNSQTGSEITWWRKGDDCDSDTTQLPNYCTDLNAMHEAEEHLHGTVWAEYFDYIQKTGKATGVRATARQRAEAFVRTWQMEGE